MRKALLVFKRDVRAIFKNPIAVIIVIGVCVIPSLYAWVNIKACWDPYKNTSTIPIAVVNKDKGTEFNSEKINIGRDVVKELRKNKDIGWKFVNERDANLGLVDGTYYAMIEITEDFSKDLTSFVSGQFVKPQLIYKVQTKSNPVAVKISGAASTNVIDEVTTNFIETVNKTIFSSANDIGKKANENKDNILKIKDSLILLDNNMDLVLNSLDVVNENGTNISNLLSQVKTGIPQLVSGLQVIMSGNNSSISLMENTREILNNTINNIQLSLESIKESNERIKIELQGINVDSNDALANSLSLALTAINRDINTLNDSLSASINFLQQVNKTNPNEEISNFIVALQGLQSSLKDEQATINNIQKDIPTTKEQAVQDIDKLINDFSSLNNNVISILETYNSTVKIQLNSIIDNYISATEDANYILTESVNLVQEIDSYVSVIEEGSELTTEMSGKIKNALIQYKDPIHSLSEKLKLISNNDIVNIISILQSDPTFMSDFISSPFTIKDDAIYKIPNYGSAMAPVYTVLALWVGGLMLTAVFKTEVKPFEGGEELTLRQKFFGRMITFVAMGLIQGLIVSVGNKLILGIYAVNPLLMILFSLASSFTFVIIIYTLAAIFGNIGKALSIIFMIIQLAGSGGTYPIQLDPIFFRVLQPFFPFTYSLGGFREAIAGPLASSVILDFSVLAIVSAIVIVFGYYAVKPLHPIISKFEGKFKESGLAEEE